MDKKNILNKNKILVLDPETKYENNKTFCFWSEKNKDIYQDYEKIISKSWKKIKINDFDSEEINPLEYHHIESSKLYDLSRKIIEQNNIDLIHESVINISQNKEMFSVETENKNYTSNWIIDSRPIDFKEIKNNKYLIYQSFFGLKVRLKNTFFKEDTYHMMDFRVDQANETQFVYILPYDKHSALVELTRFGKEIIDLEYSKNILDQYIKSNYGEYEVVDQEKGLIPMSFESPTKSGNKKWIDIGTRAGAVKPSTGYAFKSMVNHAKEICKNNKLDKVEIKNKSRFKIYDQLLLIILYLWPNKGKPIFERLYQTQTSKFILKFLDEKSTLKNEINMFSKLQIITFLNSFLIWSCLKLKHIMIPLIMVIYVLTNTNNRVSDLNNFEILFLSIGLFSVGIPHGALDHLIDSNHLNKKITFSFIFKYILAMVAIYILWLLSPLIWLFTFILFSAWHFGETDINKWGIKSHLIKFVWGLSVLLHLFSNHEAEFTSILSDLNINLAIDLNWIYIGSLVSLCSFLCYSILRKRFDWILIICFIILSSSISLVLAFSIYFIFHHSLTGWNDLKRSLNISQISMFKNALPFNLGALFIFLIYFLQIEIIEFSIAHVFIFLSCISFPHVVKMSFFYKKNKNLKY